MPFPDYVEFIACLNRHGAKYLIIGAQALAYHARPRATKDLDILVDPTATNARTVLAALHEFFNADTGYEIEDLTTRGNIIQLGVAPVRIDLMTAIAGIPLFDKAWNRRVKGVFGPERAHFISLEDLIRAKKAANRLQDRADVRVLQKAKAKGTRSPSKKK